MTKRQLKARVNELEHTLSHYEEEIHEINEMLNAINTKLERLAYEGTIGPVDGDKLLAFLISLSVKFENKRCLAPTLFMRIIDILPRYKLEKGDAKDDLP